MILKQVFKTCEGVQKRCAFENAHSKTYKYIPVRFLNGKEDTAPFNRDNWANYTWCIAKLKRV